MRWAAEVAAADRGALLAAVAALRTGAELPGVVRVSQRLLRCVARCELPSGRAAYLKLHRLPRPRDRMRYALRPLPGVAEYQALTRLWALGIAVPQALACAGTRRLLSPRESWVATAAVAPGPERVTLADALPVIDRLAAAGFCHPDLHPGNFLRAADGRVVLLDLQSLRGARGARAARSMRARCLLGFAQRDGLTLADAAAAMAAAGHWSADEARILVAQAWRHHARWLLSRARRPWVESTEFTGRGFWPRTWQRRGVRLPPSAALLGHARVAGLACAAWRTDDPAVVAIVGPAALRRCFGGDAWRQLVAGAPPRVLGCQRRHPWPWAAAIVWLRAAPEQWPGILAECLAAAADVGQLARQVRAREPSPCVTLPLQAGYNPAPSVPSAQL